MKRLGSRTLERRLTRIETTRGVRPDPHYPHLIVIRFVSAIEGRPSGREVASAELRGGGRTWHRRPDETEEAFEARVKAEARAEGMLVTVLLSEADDMLL
jgi:hypothetical protein